LLPHELLWLLLVLLLLLFCNVTAQASAVHQYAAMLP
jgi:hypothetical protein